MPNPRAQSQFKFSIIDQWMADEDDLLDWFLNFCQGRFRKSGLKLLPSHYNIQAAHSEWVVYCDEWIRNDMLPQNRNDLSHVKKLAALLHFLIKHKAVSVFESAHTSIKLSEPTDTVMHKKLISGDTAYICFIFVYNMMEKYEINRPDMADDYVSRVTIDFEKDLIVLLNNEDVSVRCLHMIFKSLFLRDKLVH